MLQPFILAPRYRLDDEDPWLEGIDPARHYWLRVNGDAERRLAIPGLLVSDLEEWQQAVRSFRALQPGDCFTLERPSGATQLRCISNNCYAIAAEMAGAPVWHLFDRETIDSFLMTSHPDWQCSERDLELGRERLLQSFGQPAVA